ncbi:MAG TPA: xanthine dehydrogenase family protein subunit M [Pseudolabrys sp.]|jgi:carbon-monoxide dehydrogenase medium subunit|nr:xanthine dehydrogenase family protein subunit M [Pseudolabrys sp.]
MKPASFEYTRPDSLDDAIALLAEHDGDAKVIAGGQSLMPMMNFRLASPRMLVDIGRIADLNRIVIASDGVRLGALVRWRDIERHPTLRTSHPLLAAAIDHVAHYQIRNRGTVGGSIAHADPAAEMPGVAVACDAEIIVAGSAGQRTIAAADFFTGALTTILQPDEIIIEVRLPAWPAGRRAAFEEFSRRKGDFALAGVAAFYDLDREGRVVDPHLAAIGVASFPVRLKAAEAALAGRPIDAIAIQTAAVVADEGLDISEDIHAPADYRRALLKVLLERALHRAAGLPASGQTT